jgi:ADP-ribose pyrophosphatase
MSGGNDDRAVRPWQVLGSRLLYEDRFVRLRADTCRTAEGTLVESYAVLECPGGVNVVALTADGMRLVLVREYRHGCGEVLLGLPAGAVDDADASLEAAARRELLEETGYGGGHFAPVANYYANAPRQTNAVTSFLALGVEPVAAQSLDAGGAEAVEVVIEDLPAVLARLRRGGIVMHATHVAGLWSAAAAILGGRAGAQDIEELRARLFAAISGEAT